MKDVPEEIKELIDLLVPENARVRVYEGIKKDLQDFMNTRSKSSNNEECNCPVCAGQVTFKNMPFELAIMALKSDYSVKRNTWTETVLVYVNGFIYMQNTKTGNLSVYNAGSEDLNTTDWELV